MTANLAQPFARYCFTTVIVMFVAGLLQFSETPGLVQVRLLPPAGPDTVSVPSQLVPSVRVRWYVNAPEKLVVVRVPPTVPLRVVPSDSGDFHVPLTLVPLCVKLIDKDGSVPCVGVPALFLNV